MSVPLSNFLPYGPEAGDLTLPPGDDESSEAIQLSITFPFMNHRERVLFVNINGLISFSSSIGDYKPKCSQMPISHRMVAPFWSDVITNNELGGQIYYRQTTDPGLLKKVSKEVSDAYEKLWGVNIRWLFIATWVDVVYYGSERCYQNSSDPRIPRNTWQAVLATDGFYSFTLFYYHKLSWTSGTAVEEFDPPVDKCTGLGGNPARVGMDDGKRFHAVPGSCTSDILNITHSSNFDSNRAPGKYAFEIDDAAILLMCDTAKYLRGEPLKVFPTFIDAHGFQPISFQGPCFNRSALVTCIFHDTGKADVIVPARTWLDGMDGEAQTPTATCGVPHLYSHGRLNITLIVKDDPGVPEMKFRGYVSVLWSAPRLNANFTRTDNDITFMFKWDPMGFSGTDPQSETNPEVSKLSIHMLAYDPNGNTPVPGDRSNRQWKDAGILMEQIPNNANAYTTMTYEQLARRLNISENLLKKTFISFQASVVDPPPPDPSFAAHYFWTFAFSQWFCGSMIYKFDLKDRDQACYRWYKNDSGPPKPLPPCPPLLLQAQIDPRFERETILEQGGIVRPGNVVVYRSRMPTEKGIGSVCTYNPSGRLIDGPKLGGNAYSIHPLSDRLEHYLNDVVPWCDCCRGDPSKNRTMSMETCGYFYNRRPSSSPADYVPPSIGTGNGDPQINTLDGLAYTFNPVGEFWFIRQGEKFAAQCRMEKFEPRTISNLTRALNASVYTALVMRQGNGPRVQVQQSAARNLEVMVEGQLLNIYSENSLAHSIGSISIYSSDVNASEISVAFGGTESGGGWAFTFTSAEGALSVQVSASPLNKNTGVRGLMGNFDGIRENDLMTLGGTIIPPDSTLEDLHWKFGMLMNVSAADSLFTYQTGRNHSDYQVPDFRPMFQRVLPNELPEEARRICKENLQCAYDYVATGHDPAFARATIAGLEKANETSSNLSVEVRMCPQLNSLENGYMVFTDSNFVGSTVQFFCLRESTLEGANSSGCIESNPRPRWTSSQPKCCVLGGTCTSSDTPTPECKFIGMQCVLGITVLTISIVGLILLIVGLIVIAVRIIRTKGSHNQNSTNNNEMGMQ